MSTSSRSLDLPTAILEDRRAVEEARTGDKVEDTPLLASGLTTDRIVAGLNRAVPPEWLQETVERNMDELGGYVTGRSDDFTLAIATDERADALLAELRALFEESDAYAVLYERVLIPQIEDAASGWARERLPLGVEISDERIVEAARAVLPPEWARQQGQRILDQTTPYLKGESDELVVSIQLSDRVDVAAAEVKDILAESPAYDLLYDEVIAPEIVERLGDTIEGLPFGTAVLSAEVVAALRDAAPSSWVREQAERLIDEASPYLAGQADGFEFEVSLVENKRLAHGVLTRFVEGKIQEQIDRLPICRTVEQALSALSPISLVGGGIPRLPACVPPSRTHGELLDELGVDIRAEVTRLVLDPVPDSVSFSHAQLREALAEAGAADNVERLDDVRSLIRDGWTYTHDDLRENLVAGGNEASYDALQEARVALADGWTYTQADFAEDVIESEGAEAMAEHRPRPRRDRGGQDVPVAGLPARAAAAGSRGTAGRTRLVGAGRLGRRVAHRVRRRRRRAVRPRLSGRGLEPHRRGPMAGRGRDRPGRRLRRDRPARGRQGVRRDRVGLRLAGRRGYRPRAWSSRSQPPSSSESSSTGSG